MAHTLHFLGEDLQHIRTYEDRTAAEPRTVDVYHADMRIPHPTNDKITNVYTVRITRRKESEEDYFFYVLMTGPKFTKSLSGYLYPLLQKNAREWLIDLLNEKIVDLVF